jgi:hypothetical protein
VPQLPTTRTLCKGMSTSTCDMYVLSQQTMIQKIVQHYWGRSRKRNQNNQNVQWISAEARDDGRNINIVTRGGAKTGDDAVRQDPTQHQWVKKNTEPQKQFDAQKEKETFKEARQEFLKKMLHLHQLHNILRTYQCTRCLHQWTTPVKHNL